MSADLYTLEHEGVRWINLLPQEAPILKHNVTALDRAWEILGPVKSTGARRVVLDIGAHVGFTTLLAAKRGAVVYAFEPNVWSFARLVNNIELNELADVIPVCAAVVGNPGSDAFDLLRMCPGSPGQSSLVYKDAIPAFGLCPLVSIGDVLHQISAGGPIDYLKIDCEGGEYDIVGWLEEEAARAVRVVNLELHDTTDARYFRARVSGPDWARARMSALGFKDLGDGLWGRE